MSTLDIKVTYIDGTEKVVTARQYDWVLLERFYDKPAAILTGAAPVEGGAPQGWRMEYAWRMAWTASRRADKTGVPDDYDAWCETVAEVEPVGGDEVPETPLAPTPSPGE